MFAADGRIAYIIHRVEDVTEFIRLKQQGAEQDKLAEELRDRTRQMESEVFLRAREVAEAKQKLEQEQRLRQVQKMEAVGHLTGGIAHDFNNILTVIIGMAEVLSEDLAGDPAQMASVRMIADAAQRGAEVTRQLLAFSRQQPLQPRETDINALVEDTAKLLRPSLGEQVEIQVSLEGDSWSALVDPSHLTTALLNLAFNARDAMEQGGKLTLETGNVYLDEAYAALDAEVLPGHYVMVAVSDTGSGIPEAIRDKVFEPFFTTKETGKGTGLGLSMVYGFVKQSNGHIKIYSEEGHGTSIKLYLPRAAGKTAGRDLPAADEFNGSGETILVVEDDPLVRQYASAQLAQLGYRAILTANGPEALAEIEKGLAFDLLFTDVIMPGGMNGRQLADAARVQRPQLRVLFSSGYTEDALFHHGRLDPGVLLLPKPYRRSDLARMIRRALNHEM